jgi:hypothetical protein
VDRVKENVRTIKDLACSSLHGRWALVALVVTLAGCPDATNVASPDAAVDAATVAPDGATGGDAGGDVGATDAAGADARPADAAVDADPPDAASADATPPDATPPDATPPDATIDAEVVDAQQPDMAVEPDAEVGPQACDPPLSVEPALAFARVYDLVTLRADGGSGRWRFSLVENRSGALLNEDTGAYLAGETTGVSDIVSVRDRRCVGEVRAEVRVVEPMVALPTTPLVPALGRFTFALSGGSGRFDFAFEENASGGQVAPDGLYVAGARLGRDVIRITDEGTGQVAIATVQVAADVAITPDPGTLILPLGASHPLEIQGGSGHFDFEVEGDGVAVAEGRVTALSPGRATIRATDRFLGLEATIEVQSQDSLQAPLVRTGDASSWTWLHAPGDLNGDGFDDAIVGLGEADLAWADAGLVAVYLGSAEGLGPDPVQVFAGANRHENFGRAVATGDIDGDGRLDLVITAQLGDLGAGDTGAVRIYRGIADGPFTAEPTWEVGGPRGGDQAGTGVALCDFNGDGRLDLAVGAILYEDRDLGAAGTNQGGVLVHLGSADGFLPRADQALLGVLPDGQGGLVPGADLRIGFTLAVGDMDGDGLCDLATSSTQFNAGRAAGDGLVAIHRGIPPDERGGLGGLSLLPVQIIAPDELESVGSNLGRRLEMGDVNGDTFADLLIARHAHDVGNRANVGEALMFLGGNLPAGPATAFTPASRADWRYVGNDAGDNVGIGIAVGDVDGDGLGDVVVGGWFDEIVGEPASTGLIHVFPGVAGGLPAAAPARQIRLPDPANTANRLFGEAVAVLGDVNGDGTIDVLSTASREDTLGDDVGQPYWFAGGVSDGARTITLPGGIGGMRFGHAVAVVGDVNNDGRPDAVVGAPFQGRNGGSRSGMAWLYLGEDDGFSAEPAVAFDQHPDHNGSDLMGWTAAPAGDFDGDGVGDFAIAARDEEPPANFNNAALWAVDGVCPARASNHGAIYIYRGVAGGVPAARPSYVYFGPANNTQQSEIGAADVNGDGRDDLIIGSLLWDLPGSNDVGGIEVVLGRPATGDARIRVLCDPAFQFLGNQQGANLGRSVIGLGDVDADGCDELAIGAARENINNLNTQGTVRILFGWGGAGCPAQPRMAIMAPNEAAAEAGFSLAAGLLDGDNLPDLVVGAPNHLVDGQRRGGVWIVPGSHIASLEKRAPEDTRDRPQAFDPRGAAWLLEGRFPGERFGTSVGAAGRLVIVGAIIGNYSGVPEVGGARIHRVTNRGAERLAHAAFIGQTHRPGERLGDRVHAGRQGQRHAFIVGGFDAQGVQVPGASMYDPGAAYGFFLDAP